MEMGMQEFVASFAVPFLRKRQLVQVCEIGSRFGEAAKLLSNVPQGNITVIDPCLDCDLVEKLCGQSRITVKKGISLAVLPQLSEAFDCILIDGDHNWYTVYHELKLIHERGLLKPGGMIFFHDIEWPWGRRDMYYQPETIPPEYRHPWEQKGVVRGKSELSETGGWFPAYRKATHEGGPRNGVLTAIEDFLHEHEREYAFFRVREAVGLGMMYRKGSFKDRLAFGSLKCKGVGFNFRAWPKRFVRGHFPGAFSAAKSLLRRS
jgi:hypothetical protein